MDAEIVGVKRFFESHQIILSDIWLESCITWCKSQNLPPNYTPRDLQNDIYGQWLQLDLRDVNITTLPPNLSTKTHFVLKENFSLQVMQIMDISKPKHWQLQQIRNSNHLTRTNQKDSDIVGTGKRMLQLTLTDGVQEVEAFEYRPIHCLNLNLPPGIKIRIIAPITVRRGRLMLEERNVKVLGGEVDELIIDNAAENVLARILNLPLNPNPVVVEENLLNTDEIEEVSHGNDYRALPPQSKKCVKKLDTSTVISEEEEKLIQEEIDFLLEAEESLIPTNLVKEADSSCNFDSQVSNMREEMGQGSQEEDNFRNNETHSGGSDNLKKLQQMKPNVLTISKLLENRTNISRGLFKIKAKFKSIVEKLTVDADEFKLVLKVGDDTGEITVKLHTDIIVDYVGYRPSVLLSLKNRILENDKEATETVVKALETVRDRLLKLDNIMEVRIIKDEEVPTILRIL